MALFVQPLRSLKRIEVYMMDKRPKLSKTKNAEKMTLLVVYTLSFIILLFGKQFPIGFVLYEPEQIEADQVEVGLYIKPYKTLEPDDLVFYKQSEMSRPVGQVKDTFSNSVIVQPINHRELTEVSVENEVIIGTINKSFTIPTQATIIFSQPIALILLGIYLIWILLKGTINKVQKNHKQLERGND